ncbi:ABC transporter substrate-binding protein [Pelagibius sp. Alg239-R121]|uniref:ABC transporter substrate-binding protein n=1 Tax=Pelagibius sp. Alg239-R121 TaxID=2993448 RepID=UPI0024A6E1DE|nr:ABC transporter substrate-binding protein [Pelagibius sp. Alg239-R121]
MVTRFFRNALPTLLLLCASAASSDAIAESTALKVGVLKFGTVNWQLDSLKFNAFDSAQSLDLEVVALASKNATSVALQAGNADMIVSDWIWVNRQRAGGEDFVFVPYSNALGALVLGPDSAVTDVTGLKNKKIGIAGGPVDKNWLLLRAWTRKFHGFDIADSAEAIFAAPPLLNEQLRTGRLDAVLTFWPYAARLEAGGATRLFDVSDLVKDLGVTQPTALIGYVFRERLLNERPGAVEAFFGAVSATNVLLEKSDSEWKRLRPAMRAKSDAEFEALKSGFRQGMAMPFAGAEEGGEDQDRDRKDAELLFGILATVGGEKLVGRNVTFDPNTFWTPETSKPDSMTPDTPEAK